MAKHKALIKKKTKHSTDIVMGDEYRDSVTGVKGTATSVTFFLHACERVTLEFMREGKLAYEVFDAPRLIHVETEAVPKVTKTGGPGGTEARPAEVLSHR